MNYESYLNLETLLSAQQPVSFAKGRPAHDEMLFISIHHTYEIWFKQVLFELDSVLKLFAASQIDEKEMGTAVARLTRINAIFQILVQQISVLETMTPMDFLEFRDLIYSASGFQSYQFRLLENKLGLKAVQRLNYNSEPYHAPLSSERAQQVQQAEQEMNLFDGVERWLSRTPFLETSGFEFWKEYRSATNIMFQQDEGFIQGNPHLNETEKAKLRQNINMSRQMFASLFDEGLYNKKRDQGEWRLSYRAVHAALLIQLYREQPVFQIPFRLITEILTLDSHLTQWRYRHTLLVKRMLGSRIGTGGSTGAKYLRESTEQHKIFEDFYKLTTFFIPRSRLPNLPAELEKVLGFQFNSSNVR